jgi:hypothetical protein
VTPSASAQRLFHVEAALGAFAKLGRFDVSSIEIDANTAVVWIAPPADGTQLAETADLFSRTTIGRSVEEIRVVRHRANRVELRWIERFQRVAKVPS